MRGGTGRYTGRKQSQDNIEILRDICFSLSNDVTKIFNALIHQYFQVIVIKYRYEKTIVQITANNNRPISLLLILSKICEKAALNQFLPYLVSNDRLTTKQSGNKRFQSTETSLIHTTDFILNAIDKKKITAIVLLDMSKAFDSINHGILLNKLQDIGDSISALQWFNSYLSNRTQTVRIHSALSDPLSTQLLYGLLCR